MRKKGIIINIVILSLLILSVTFFFSRNQKQSLPSLNELQEMSGAECIELFEQYGLVLPVEYKDHEEQAEKDVKYILDNMQDTSIPYGVIAINRVGIHELADQIENILYEYGGNRR